MQSAPRWMATKHEHLLTDIEQPFGVHHGAGHGHQLGTVLQQLLQIECVRVRRVASRATVRR